MFENARHCSFVVVIVKRTCTGALEILPEWVDQGSKVKGSLFAMWRKEYIKEMHDGIDEGSMCHAWPCSRRIKLLFMNIDFMNCSLV